MPNYSKSCAVKSAGDLERMIRERPLLLKVPAVAQLLDVSERTVEGLIAHDELASLLIGRSRRVRRVDLDAYIEHRLEAETHATDVHIQPLASEALRNRDAENEAARPASIRKQKRSGRDSDRLPQSA